MVEEIERVSKQHPELFHYTTVAAFKSIYESRQFWATHYEHLNDSSEFGRFRLNVTEFIKPIIREKKKIFDDSIQHDAGGIDALVCQEAAMHLDTLHRTTFGERGFRETFICCFCAHGPSYEAANGLLSQWRGYGTGAGVAIVLDTKVIEELMRHEKCIFAHPVNHIGDVTYDNDPDLKQKPEFRTVFDLFPEILDMFYKREQPSYEGIFKGFVMGSTLVKHHAFHEETEVRIVVSPTPTNQKSFFYTDQDNRKPIKYRSRLDDRQPVKWHLQTGRLQVRAPSVLSLLNCSAKTSFVGSTFAKCR
jgi:Protein of unknown function (DUF2971)